MKIVHIAKDDKFLDQAIPVFEKIYPGANDVVVFAPEKLLKNVKLTPNKVETKKTTIFDKSPKLPECFYKDYDLVIFHSLDASNYPELTNIPVATPRIWIGWGFDYYPELLTDITLYLEKTTKLYVKHFWREPRKVASYLWRKVKKQTQLRTKKVWAVEQISIFAPVLPQEYDMVKKSRSWRAFPEFGSWNYGTLEDNLIKGFEGERITGNAILVGNSASYTANHVDAFHLLRKLKVSDRSVVAPLSYGDERLALALCDVGDDYFGEKFEPLLAFLPIEDYVALIRKCGYVIMNHVRQQALGNIVIMVYLGARVFLRQENPIYSFFKAYGVVLSTVQELEVDPLLLETPLTDEEKALNRDVMSRLWCRERAYDRTRALVEKAVSDKQASNRKNSTGLIS